LYGRLDPAKLANMTAEELMAMYHDIFLKGPDVFKRLTKENGNPLSDYELDEKLKWFVKLKGRGLIKES
jgi:hypothetical protein